jgi:hypothetical protein
METAVSASRGAEYYQSNFLTQMSEDTTPQTPVPEAPASEQAAPVTPAPVQE